MLGFGCAALGFIRKQEMENVCKEIPFFCVLFCVFFPHSCGYIFKYKKGLTCY